MKGRPRFCNTKYNLFQNRGIHEFFDKMCHKAFKISAANLTNKSSIFLLIESSFLYIMMSLPLGRLKGIV